MQEKYLLFLSGVINENEFHEEAGMELKNYMFFSNLRTIKEKVDKLLSMDANLIDKMIEDGHDWASDHIATSKDDVEEVYNWISSVSKQ
jgi:hypothetical protein